MNEKDLEQYTPTIIEAHGRFYGEMLVELTQCPSCKRPMVDANKAAERNTFAQWHRINLRAQLERADWGRVGTGRLDDAPICERCTTEGRGSFKCAMCGERRDSSKIKEGYGDPPEYLCSVCFETRTAKEWDDADKRLTKEHMYDFD